MIKYILYLFLFLNINCFADTELDNSCANLLVKGSSGKRLFWTQQKISATITKLHSLGHSLHIQDIETPSERLTQDFQKLILSSVIKPYSMAKAVQRYKYWPTWKSAVEAQELSYPEDKVVKIFWTKDKIQYVILELYKRGFKDLSPAQLRIPSAQLLDAFLSIEPEAKGGPYQMVQAMHKYNWHSDWAGLLVDNGTPIIKDKISLDEVVSKNHYPPWTKGEVKITLSKLSKRGFDISAKSFRNPSTALVSNFRKITGRHMNQPQSMYLAVLKKNMWPNWHEAIKESTGKNMRQRNRPIYWTEERVINVIKSLQSLGYSDFREITFRLPNEKFEADFRQVTGKKIRPISMIKSFLKGNVAYSSWSKVLKVNGIDSPQRELRWSRDRFITTIKTLFESGFDVNIQSFKNPTEDFRLAYSKILENTDSPTSFYRAFIESDEFENWDALLLASDLNPTEIKKRITWDKNKLIETIKAMSEDTRVRRQDFMEPTEEFLEFYKRFSEYPDLHPRKFVSAVIRPTRFSTWENFIIESGVPQSKGLKYPIWTRKYIAEIILHLYQKKHSLEFAESLYHPSQNFIDDMIKFTDFSFHPRTLHKYARSLFGSWDEALNYSLKAVVPEVKVNVILKVLPSIPAYLMWDKERKNILFSSKTLIINKQYSKEELLLVFKKMLAALTSQEKEVLVEYLSGYQIIGVLGVDRLDYKTFFEEFHFSPERIEKVLEKVESLNVY